MQPIITIGMPVFNDKDFIEQSLISILKQSERNFVLIVSDDGSTDGSADICKTYASGDSRIKYIRQPENLGISKNMEFLLKQSETPYFMWAADDDLWDADFIKMHIEALEADKKSIVSFCNYRLIDEDNNEIKVIDIDYGHRLRFFQLIKLVWFSDDGFGYGVFKTDKIQQVKFPVWWWPNKKTPYNNIYPSLCFYLNNGRYLHQDAVLFQKRVKVGKRVNHTIGGSGNGIKELVSFYLRRFYLVHFSVLQSLKSYTWFNAVFIYPVMLVKWFLSDSVKMTYNSVKNKLFRKNSSVEI